MAKEFIKGEVNIGIVSEFDSTTPTITGTNATHLGGDGNTSSLIDAAGADSATYALIKNIESVSIDNWGIELEEFEHLDDNFTHEIDVRDVGSCTISAVGNYDASPSATADGIPLNYLQFASMDFPNGFNTPLTGSADISFNPATDNTTTTRVLDKRGYAVRIERKMDTAGTYVAWILHNAKINVLPGMETKKGTRYTLTVSDARYIDFLAGTTTLVDADHGDSTIV